MSINLAKVKRPHAYGHLEPSIAVLITTGSRINFMSEFPTIGNKAWRNMFLVFAKSSRVNILSYNKQLIHEFKGMKPNHVNIETKHERFSLRLVRSLQ